MESALREAWWPAAAAVARMTGDLTLAEDAAQDACAAAWEQWPRSGVPPHAVAWVISVARRRAIDHLRREKSRPDRERRAVEQLALQHGLPAEDGISDTADTGDVAVEDQLGLLFASCHPALETSARICLTLRVVCGLPTASIARLLLVPEPTAAQRIVRAKRKIREAGIRLELPGPRDRTERLDSVLQVVYLTFTEGHTPYGVDAVVRPDLCEEALRLAGELHRLLPEDPEVTGLLALLLLTSARSGARVDDEGALVLLGDQDRSRWDHARIRQGTRLVVEALAHRRPGRYQLQAAIAACHAEAPAAEDTDWRQVALLYGELLRQDPSPVVQANRAVAVAYADGPAAGLALLDTLTSSSELARWPQLHIARAALLVQLGRRVDAEGAYREALALEPAPSVRAHITRRLSALRDQRTH